MAFAGLLFACFGIVFARAVRLAREFAVARFTVIRLRVRGGFVFPSAVVFVFCGLIDFSNVVLAMAGFGFGGFGRLGMWIRVFRSVFTGVLGDLAVRATLLAHGKESARTSGNQNDRDTGYDQKLFLLLRGQGCGVCRGGFSCRRGGLFFGTVHLKALIGCDGLKLESEF